MRYLVDTDWVVDYLNGIQRTVRNFNRFLPDGVGISIISMAEIYDGLLAAAARNDDELQLDRFLESVEVVPLERHHLPDFCWGTATSEGRRKHHRRLRPSDRLHGASP